MVKKVYLQLSNVISEINQKPETQICMVRTNL